LLGHAEAVSVGAQLVLLCEGKWLAKWDLDEVKLQIMSYAHKLYDAIEAYKEDLDE
jgi:hypothetical protein